MNWKPNKFSTFSCNNAGLIILVAVSLYFQSRHTTRHVRNFGTPASCSSRKRILKFLFFFHVRLCQILLVQYHHWTYMYMNQPPIKTFCILCSGWIGIRIRQILSYWYGAYIHRAYAPDYVPNKIIDCNILHLFGVTNVYSNIIIININRKILLKLEQSYRYAMFNVPFIHQLINECAKSNVFSTQLHGV